MGRIELPPALQDKLDLVPLGPVKNAIFGINAAGPTRDRLRRSIPNSKMKLLQAWIELHKDELVADWELAVSGQQPYKIDPLR